MSLLAGAVGLLLVGLLLCGGWPSPLQNAATNLTPPHHHHDHPTFLAGELYLDEAKVFYAAARPSEKTFPLHLITSTHLSYRG